MAAKRALAALPLLETLGRTRFEQIFGGVTRGTSLDRIRVYLTEPSPEVEQAMAAVFDGPIEFRITARTEAEQDRLHARITAERDQLAEAGIEVIRWGPVIRTGYEQVGVLHLTDEKRAVLLDTFGPWLDLYNVDDYPHLYGGSTNT